MSCPPKLIVIANEVSRRWQFFLEEWQRFGNEDGTELGVELVPWREVIHRGGNLDQLGMFDAPAVVRLESPGEEFEVTKLLLQAGDKCELGSGTSRVESNWMNLEYQLGRLVRPGLIFRGFQHVLTGLAASLQSRPHLDVLASPLDVALMFDKNKTAEKLSAAGLPCPEGFEPPRDWTAARLLEELTQRQIRRAYVKLASGSSATGIAVVHACEQSPWALTSVASQGDDFFNSLRILSIEGDALSRVLDFLLSEGACVQRGISMAQIDGQNFDVRVIVIDGAPAFTLFRLSSDPMTNLHFGGRRGRVEECRAQIPKRVWLDAMDDCVEAAALFDAAMVGIDLVFERGLMRHFLLEVNAFGDFFPGWTNAVGKTIHRVEIESIAQRLARMGSHSKSPSFK